MPKPLDTSLWESGRHVGWMHDFRVPGIDTPEAEAISMMSDNLRKVSEKGGRGGVRRDDRQLCAENWARAGGSRNFSAAFGCFDSRISAD